MTSRSALRAHFRPLLALAVVGAGLALPLLPSTPAWAGCGGNQTVRYAPYECSVEREIDGTVFRANLSASATTITVTIQALTPRDVDTPVRVRAHRGISSNPNTNEGTGVIPAGSTAPVVLTVGMNCGQIDVKAVYTDNGDARGRITAPFLSEVDECGPATTTTTGPTTAPSTAPTSVPATTVPTGSTIPTTAPPEATSVPGTTPTPNLPSTGSSPWMAFAGLAVVGGGLALGRIAGRRDTTAPGQGPAA